MMRALLTQNLAIGAGVMMIAMVTTFYVRHAQRSKLASVSIPEALHALTHSTDATLRSLAARALCSILFGEVQVLEELLDEVRRKHAEFGASRSDGRSLLDVAIEDASAGSTDAAMLLLACTERDAAWDDADEWNEMTAEAACLLGQVPGAAAALERARTIAAQTLLARVRGCHSPTPPGFSLCDAAYAPRLAIPDVLPFNTRVCCAECGLSLQFSEPHPRCAACNNVGYCCVQHARLDFPRHAVWCTAPRLRI